MKLWDYIFKAAVLIIGVIVITFNVQLYIACKHQRDQLDSIKDKQDVEAEFNSNKFKYQQDQTESLKKELENARQQIQGQKEALADQRDSLLQETQKRQQVENESKSVQTSLVDIKAEADAIKEDMKGWQKDYVVVLAQLEKGVNGIQDQIKGLHDNLNSLNIPALDQKINTLQAEVEKISPPPAPSDSSVPEKKTEHEHLEPL